MDTQSYNKLCHIIYRQSGIQLREGKETMLATRIAHRLQALGLEDERDYVNYLNKSMKQEIGHLLDAVSTNFTSFFRESVHFDVVRDVMKGWLDKGQSKFRCWSAAASTGEEPYTLAIVLKEACRQAGRSADVRVLGTDINNQVLQKAKQGVYREQILERVPIALRNEYFTPVAGTSTPSFRVKPEITSMMHYRRLNLSAPPFPLQGPMDIIFCRNVMIYFDDPIIKRLIQEFHRLLKPGGYLFVGHSEGIKDIKGMFTTVASSAYRKIES